MELFNPPGVCLIVVAVRTRQRTKNTDAIARLCSVGLEIVGLEIVGLELFGERVTNALAVIETQQRLGCVDLDSASLPGQRLAQEGNGAFADRFLVVCRARDR